MKTINSDQQATPLLTAVEESQSIPTANLGASQLETPSLDLKIVNAMKHEEDAQQPPADPAALAKKIEKIADVLEQQTEPLTEEESADFAKLTETALKSIDNSLIGIQALREIRDRQLYRGSHKTFQDFCDEVLDISEQRVSQILKCAEEIAKLQEGEIPEAHIPSSERAIRELRRVKNPKNKAKILQMAAKLAGQGKLTSALILNARVEIEGEPEEKEKAAKINVAAVLKAAELVKKFVETQSFDKLKVIEYKQLGSAVNAIAKYADKLEAQAA